MLRPSSAASPYVHLPRSFSRNRARIILNLNRPLFPVQAWRPRSSWAWGSRRRRAPDNACRATNLRRSMRHSDVIHTHRARRKRLSVRISTCEQTPTPSLARHFLERLSSELRTFQFHRDLKTVTIWFQNKRQTVARSRRQLESEGTTTSTAAMDMLASASATMSPLAATEEPYVSLASAIHPGAGAQRSYPDCPSLSQSAPRSPHPSSCDSISQSHQPRVPLSAVAHDPNVFFFESVRTEMSSTCVSSPSPDLRKPGDWSIHPEDLWKHIPSSPAQPALSSPDVSPDINTPSRSSRLLVQRPRTLEWACARSAKRRRTNPGVVYHEDGETDSECNPIEGPCSSFSISEARVPLECYDRYPLDVVRGAVLLLGLRDAACDLEL